MTTAARTLLQELESRFVTSEVDVDVGGVPLSILKPRNSDDLISEEDFVADDRLPYWADVWPSSLILGAHVATLPERGSLLELGCGLGIVSIMAMRAGFDVTATDYYEDALRFTRANALRTLGREPAARLVDWRALPADLGQYDVVLAADVLYEMRYAELVAGAIATAMAPTGIAIVADPGRVAVAEFVTACGLRGLECTERLTRPFAEGTIRQNVSLYVLRAAATPPRPADAHLSIRTAP